jgi:hypothetical protein
MKVAVSVGALLLIILRRRKMTNMPPLPSDIRELVLFMVQDIQEKLNKVEEMLCLSDEEEEND